MTSSHLMLSTKAEEDGADDLMAALSSLAYAAPKPAEQPVKKVVKKKKKKRVAKEVPRRSQFFFKLSKSITQETEERKASLTRSPMETIDNEVTEAVKKYSQSLPPELSSNIENVREFFTREIAPKTLAVQGGMTQAQEVIQRTINSELTPESLPFGQFNAMVAHARLYKMAEFVVSYMGLPKPMVRELVDSVKPKKEVMFVGPQMFGGEDSRPAGPRRHERVKNAEDQLRERE